MRTQRCETCRYFYEEKANEVSECRRYPPRPVADPEDSGLLSAFWPDVEQDQWCGEWSLVSAPAHEWPAADEGSCVKEVDRLARYILSKFPNEPGRGHDNGIGPAPRTSESAVDVAIRLMSYLREMADRNCLPVCSPTEVPA